MNARGVTAGCVGVVFSALFQAGAMAAGGLPFGFDHDKSPSQYDYCYKVDDHGKYAWQCRNAPQRYHIFDIYNARYIDGIGFCRISVIEEFSSPYGVKDTGMKVFSQLEEIYGRHTTYKFYPDPNQSTSDVEGGLFFYGWLEKHQFTPARGIKALRFTMHITMSYSSIAIDFSTTKTDQCRAHEDQEERKALGG